MRRPPMLPRCSEALAQLLFAAFTRRALRPGNVARGDRCVRGTLAPRHHAGTNNLLSKALDATGRKADLVPRHYRILACSAGTPRRECDVPRRGRPAVAGRCASLRPPDGHRRGAHHRLVGACQPHVGPSGVRCPQNAPVALDERLPAEHRGRDDDIAASARPAEAGCVAAMPTKQFRISFVPLTSTRRSNAGSIHGRTLHAHATPWAVHHHRVFGYLDRAKATSSASDPAPVATTMNCRPDLAR